MFSNQFWFVFTNSPDSPKYIVAMYPNVSGDPKKDIREYDYNRFFSSGYHDLYYGNWGGKDSWWAFGVLPTWNELKVYKT